MAPVIRCSESFPGGESMAREASNANMTSILLRAIMSSWYAKIALLVAVAAVAGAVYWYRDSISLAAASVEESVISLLGLGVVAVALWVTAFALALLVHRSLFRHYRMWLASPFFMAFLLGVLSFFAPFQGPLARFTLEGDRHPRRHGRIRHCRRGGMARRAQACGGLRRCRRDPFARRCDKGPRSGRQIVSGTLHCGDGRRRGDRTWHQLQDRSPASRRMRRRLSSPPRMRPRAAVGARPSGRRWRWRSFARGSLRPLRGSPALNRMSVTSASRWTSVPPTPSSTACRNVSPPRSRTGRPNAGPAWDSTDSRNSWPSPNLRSAPIARPARNRP